MKINVNYYMINVRKKNKIKNIIISIYQVEKTGILIKQKWIK